MYLAIITREKKEQREGESRREHRTRTYTHEYMKAMVEGSSGIVISSDTKLSIVQSRDPKKVRELFVVTTIQHMSIIKLSKFNYVI